MRNAVIAVAIATAVTALVTTRLSARQDEPLKQMVGPMERDVVYTVSFCGAHDGFAPGLSGTTFFFMKPQRSLGGWAEAEYSVTSTQNGKALTRPLRGTFNLAHLCYMHRTEDPIEVR